jgi:hypothetical protein
MSDKRFTQIDARVWSAPIDGGTIEVVGYGKATVTSYGVKVRPTGRPSREVGKTTDCPVIAFALAGDLLDETADTIVGAIESGVFA